MITVFGTLTKRGGLAMNRYYRDFRGLDLDDLDVLPVVPVDVDHSGVQVGQVAHIERNQQGDIRLVAAVDLDDLVDISQRRDIFLSGEFVTTTSSPTGRAWVGAEPCLKSVGLTFEPCSVGAVPASVVAGDITQVADRCGWPVGRLGQYPILQRCLDRHRPGGRLVLHDLTEDHRARRGSKSPAPTPAPNSTAELFGLHYSGGYGEILGVH